MTQTVEKLQITGITSQALTAYRATNKLAGMVNTLSTSLNKMDTSVLAGFASSVEDISYSMQGMNTLTYEVTTGLNESNDTIEDTTKNAFSLSSAIGKMAQSIPNVKNIIDKFAQAIPNIKAAIGEIYYATESTEKYFKSFNYYTDTFAEIASKWDEDFETYGSENAKRYANTFVKEMNESLSKLSGMKVSLSVDMESSTLTESGMKDLGLNAQEVTQFAAELASISNAMRQTGDVSLATANVFTKLAGDLSSVFNVDYSSIVKDLQNALLGQSDALEKYDIYLSDAELQTYAYTYGLEKSVDEMTEAEKMQLSMIAILKQSDKYWGNLANNINTPANMFRQLVNNSKEVVTVLGQLFMPVLELILPIIDGVAIAIGNLLTNIARVIGVKINPSSMGFGTRDYKDELEDVTTGFDDATSSAKSFKSQLQGFDKLNLLTAQETNGISGGSSSGGSVDLTDEILDSASEYEKVWNKAFDNMENKAQQFAKKFASAFKPIEDIIRDFAIGDFFQAGQDTSKLIVSLSAFLSNAINSVDWEEVGNDIGRFLAGLEWKEILDSLGELFWDAVEAVLDVWKGTFEAAPIETGIITAIGFLTWTGLGSALAESIMKNVFGVNLSNISIVISSFAFSFAGTAGFDIIGAEILGKIEDSIEILLPDWAEELLGNIVAGLSVGGVVGSWFPGYGTIAGAILGGIIGALDSIKIDEQSIIDIYIEKLFNFDMALTWLEQAKKSFETAFDGKRQDWLDMGSHIFEGVVEGMLAAVTYVTEPFTDWFWWVWDGVCEVFDINSPAKEMEPLGTYIFDGVLKGISDGFPSMDSTLQVLLDDYINPWFSKEEWSFDGIKKGLSEAFNNAINSIKGIWNSFATWINDALSFKFDGLTKTFDVLGEKIEIGLPAFAISLGKLPTFETYVSGGFPEDGWFRASHGEIMGRFDNGQSVVANNMQITEGIAQGVREAVSGVLIPYLADIADSSRRTANKDFTVASRDVFEAVRAESSNYTRRTGELAFV